MQKEKRVSLAKRVVALLMSLAMTLTLFTFTAFAAEEETTMCTVTVTNGASEADVAGEAYNSLHVYDENDPKMDDFTGTKEFPVGSRISYYPWPNASDIRLTVVHNGVTLEDRIIEAGTAGEPVTITLEGDLSITTAVAEGGEEEPETEYTLSIANRAGRDPSISVDGNVAADGDAIAAGTHTILVQGDYVTDELMEAYATLYVGGEQVGEPTEIGYDDAEFADVNVNGDVLIAIAPQEEPAEEKYTASASIAEDVPGDVMVYVDETEITAAPAEIAPGSHSFTVYGDYSDGQEEAVVTLTVGGETVGTATDLNGYTGVTFENIEVTGDVVISVTMPKQYTVSYENKVTDESVAFNVMTVDFSGDAPAPARIESGDALKEGSYVGVQVLNPLGRKLILTRYDAQGKAVETSLINEAAEAEEGAGGIIIDSLDGDVNFVLSYACAVTVENGAAEANTDYNVNGLHVYSDEYMDGDDIEGTAYLAEGTPISIYAYPTASPIHINIVHNGEVVADRNLDRIQAFIDDDKIEWFEFDLAGDLQVTTAAAFTVNVEDRAGSEGVIFNVATVDFSGDAPQQVVLHDGDTVMAGDMVASNVVNDGTDMLRLQAVKEDGTLIEEAYIAPTTANGIMIQEAASHVRFILSKAAAAPLDTLGTVELAKTSYAYTGNALKPAVTVKAVFGIDEVTLEKDTDYTVTYTDNVKVGTAKVTVTGKGAYSGTIEKTFAIKKASIAKAKLTVANKTYTGKALKPAVTVKLGSKTLKAGTDYTVAYKNNVKAGKATVTVTGKGSYTGSAKTTFTINKAKNPVTVKASAKSVKVSKVKKAKQTVAPLTVKKAQGKVTYKKVSGAKALTINAKTGKVTVKKGTAKGTYKIKVKVTAAGNANYKKLTKTVTVKVTVK